MRPSFQAPVSRHLVALMLLASGCTATQVSHTGPAAREAPTDGSVAAPLPLQTGAHVDTLHGVAVRDPYRFLEDTLSPVTREWVAVQERYTTAVIGGLVGVDSLTAVYDAAFRDAPTLGRVVETRAGLLLRRWLGDAPSLFVTDRDGSAERGLISADQLGEALGTGTVVREVTPSPDGRHFALGTTRAGDAGAAITIVDAVTGAIQSDQIPDLLTTTSGTRYQVSWLPDTKNGAFFYPRHWPGSKTGPPSDRLARGRQFLHRIGCPQSEDRPVFGFEVSGDVPMEPEDLATRVHTAPASRWLVGSVFRSRRNGSEHYAARRTPGDSTVPTWSLLFNLEERAGGCWATQCMPLCVAARTAGRLYAARSVIAEPTGRTGRQ